MIRDVGTSVSRTIMESVGRAVSRVQERRPLPVDLLESEDAYLAIFDAPGTMSSDIQVRYDKQDIVVQIDRFREFHDGFDLQFPGRGLSLDGSVTLPEDAVVEPAEATATLKQDGTLHVVVPKAQPDTTD